MEILRQTFTAPSSDGSHTLTGVVFAPTGAKKGYFQVVHGMTEHMERYERFLREMAQEGWVCFGHDHLGHGKTANNDAELGYIAPKDGWDLLCRDVAAFYEAVKEAYPVENATYSLMGHSMGSFVVRLAAAKYVSPDRLIIMGTGGPNGAAGAGLALIGVIRTLYGDRHVSGLIDQIAFGSYNKRFGGGTTDDPKPWLTNDEAVRRRYYADKYCTFPFTVCAMGDLIRLIKHANASAWYKSLPKNLPVLLVSGKEDPVGDYGTGVLRVKTALEKQGISTTCVLYEGARHEILNDFTYDAVKTDILRFCDVKTDGV